MKDLAPNLTRQRLLIEGFYKIKVGRKVVEDYFKHIRKEENQGYDAFVPLIDSGISAYIYNIN